MNARAHVLAALIGVFFASRADAIGHTTRTVVDEARGRTIPLHIYYPTDAQGPTSSVGDVPVFPSLSVVESAPMKPGKAPLTVISHGSGGTPFDLAWLVPTLVERGHVVVMLTHPGNNWDDLDDRETLQIWNRPRDVTVALDHVLADEAIAPHVDGADVLAIGHSLGGYTVLALGGARYDVARARTHCASVDADPSCHFVPNVDRSTIDYGPSSLSYRDPRVTRIVALAPAVGRGIDPRSYADVTARVLIIATRDDALTVVDHHALRHAHALDTPVLVLPTGSHYAFIGPCNLAGRFASLIALEACQEPGRTPRAEIHTKVARAIVTFLDDG